LGLSLAILGIKVPISASDVEIWAAQPPFSFVYGGKPSTGLLSHWLRGEKIEPTTDGREKHTITYDDPSTGLEVAVEVTRCKDFPALDWVMRFSNRGNADSPLLEQVLPLNLRFGVHPGDMLLHHSNGSTATDTDFLPVDEALLPDAAVDLAPHGGRSSMGVLPFFNLAWPGGGLVWAVGWSGQWAQHVERSGSDAIELKAGQQTFRAILHPGESIRTPRILMMPWPGDDYLIGQNLLRRVLLAHYVPRRDGEIVMPPVSQNSWFVFDAGNGTTEANQLEHIRALPALGGEVWWLDAGWFQGGWPHGVGSLVPKPENFPHGLRPLADEAHKLGLKFLVWFETERVAPTSPVATEHPEFVLGWKTGKSRDGLFNLGDPIARGWLTDQLSKCIGEWEIDIYRTDFNRLMPLDFWHAADSPERQGITENHYIEGLYTMWDELLRRHPNLVFDDCAAGGRRIDLEMITRSYNLSRSDTPCLKPSTAAWDQAQTAGLSLFVPLNSTLSTSGLPGYEDTNLYALRSSAGVGFSVCQDNLAKGFPTELFKKVIAEVRTFRPLYQGDFYPLTTINTNNEAWCAWQFDRPELGRGFAEFFRRPLSPNPTIEVSLHGLEAEGRYAVTWMDSDSTTTLRGSALSKLRVEIADRPGTAVMRYRKLDQNDAASLAPK
jgi:alpha-galactosidase